MKLFLCNGRGFKEFICKKYGKGWKNESVEKINTVFNTPTHYPCILIGDYIKEDDDRFGFYTYSYLYKEDIEEEIKELEKDLKKLKEVK